jgi:hypothetical protein
MGKSRRSTEIELRLKPSQARFRIGSWSDLTAGHWSSLRFGGAEGHACVGYISDYDLAHIKTAQIWAFYTAKVT